MGIFSQARSLVDGISTFQTVLGWFVIGGPVLSVLGLLWAAFWDVPFVWWPAIAIFAAAAALLLIGLWAWATRMLALKREQDLADKFAPAFVSAVQVIIGNQQPKRGPITATADIQVGDVTLSSTATTDVFVSLRDAMVQALNETNDGYMAGFARGASDDDPERVLNWYATYSVKHLPIYGVQPPATVRSLIDKQHLLKRLHFDKGATEVSSLYATGPRYEKLEVKQSDLDAYLPLLKSADREMEEAFR